MLEFYSNLATTTILSDNSQMNLHEARVWAINQLTSSSESPQLDADTLLCESAGVQRARLFSHPETNLTQTQQARFNELVQRRSQGEPVAYLVGSKEFWSLPLTVTTDVLVPRPETELLVEKSLAALNQNDPDILELGTGSGAIALAIAHEIPNADIVATDKNEKALHIARSNAASLNITNVRFLLSDWYHDLGTQRFDLIVSNPPYIASNDPHLEHRVSQHEPQSALLSGDDGLDDIRQILKGAPDHLTAGGSLLIEHGWQQADHVHQLFCQQGFSNVRLYNDLHDRPRVTTGEIAS